MRQSPVDPPLAVAIVGAGFAGIGLGIQLRRAGYRDFAIFERRDQVGGTWHDNVYPGVACDVPSHLYSYSFRLNPSWSRFFAEGAEIQQYLHDAVQEEGLGEHLKLGVDVESMHWNEVDELWEITAGNRVHRAMILVVACGRLSEPRFPEVPGMQQFQGSSFHSAAWETSFDPRGRRITVVGSGASSIQLVPHLAQTAQKVTVLQRTAPYIVPRNDHGYAAAERGMFHRVPESMEALRARLFWKQEEGFAARALIPGQLEAARVRALGHLSNQVHDASLLAQLTPTYELGCKRVLLSDTYYPALQEPNVTLVSSALERVEEHALVAADGTRVEADAIIYATGFQSTRQPYASRVQGIGGVTLSESWSQGMRAFASTVVPGFPNMFIINGPNASLGHNSAVVMIETQIKYILGGVDHWCHEDRRPLDVLPERAEKYDSQIQALSQSTVWIRGGCDSWYLDEKTRRLSLIWPGSAADFRRRNGSFNPADFARLGSDKKPATDLAAATNADADSSVTAQP